MIRALFLSVNATGQAEEQAMPMNVVDDDDDAPGITRTGFVH